MSTFEQLADHIKDGRNPESRKLMNNTYAEYRGPDAIAVRLHSTDVLTYSRNGKVTYNTGGWHTVTTKARFNDYGPNGYQVYSDKGIWTLSGRGVSARYFDGLRLDPETATILNPEDGPDWESIDAENAKLAKSINEYVNLYTDDRIRELVEDAKNGNHRGDCLMCQFGADNHMGDEHFLAHFEEGYTMASTMLNAYKFKGYGDPGLVLLMDAERTPKDVRAHLRKFLRAQLVKSE